MEPLPKALAALAGCTVTRLCVDDSVTLALHALGRAVTLRVDGPGRLQRAGAAHGFDTDADPATAAALLGLLYDTVASGFVGADGTLEIRFASGAHLSVPASEHGVAWSLHTADGARASCIAEGRVVWE
ncbi:MAG: DUF6188 family protein [Elioraea sp.]|nr:DUF6188 family protein [Elioraea sp.]